MDHVQDHNEELGRRLQTLLCAKACVETKDLSLTVMIVSAFAKTSIFEAVHGGCD